MLTALVLTLKPTTTATVPTFLGRAAHAWFLDEVRQVNLDLAQALHNSDPRRPFTVSSLWCPARSPRRGRLKVTPAHTCHLRITSLTPALTACLSQTLAPAWLGSTLQLTGVPFTVSDLALDQAHHPQAGMTTYLNLGQCARRSAPPKHITLDFLSPTTFRRSPSAATPFDDGSYDLPVPLPRLVFGGLLALWNELAPEPFPWELEQFLRDCVVISRYRLHTELVSFGGGRQGRVGGFVGTCRFAFRCEASTWQRTVAVLADFAPFAGIGWRTTMGLGQVRLHNE
jgi:CRISPR-associated endoribonuclease Cas6